WKEQLLSETKGGTAQLDGWRNGTFKTVFFSRSWRMNSKMESGKGQRRMLANLLALVLSVSASARSRRACPPGITIAGSSGRVVSGEESRKRAPDVIGPDIAVRLRLSNKGTAAIYYFGWPNQIIPLGYRVKQSNNDLVWLWGKTGAARTSPGL